MLHWMADLMLEGEDNYRDITIVKDQSLSKDVRQNLPDYKSVVDDPSYASPNYEGKKREWMFDVVGSMCQNSDKFAVDRVLNVNPEIGDLCIIHSKEPLGSVSIRECLDAPAILATSRHSRLETEPKEPMEVAHWAVN